MYARVVKLYFGGMARHFDSLRTVLRPGARLAYVVGDQASYLRVMIRTGQLLAELAQSLGYEVIDIDLFRTRLATATRAQLREEVLLLRWPGAAPTGAKMAPRNRYSAIVEAIFHGRYGAGDNSVEFHRDQLTAVALSLGVAPPRNLGDVIYTFRG